MNTDISKILVSSFIFSQTSYFKIHTWKSEMVLEIEKEKFE